MPKKSYLSDNSSKRVTNLSIQSGIFRGIKLKSPQSSVTHPMGSREKMALFNMLTPYLESAAMLDLYAGSGALGFEALSLGAKTVVFVEKNPHIAQVIKDNLYTVQEVIEGSIASGRLPLNYTYACEIKEMSAVQFCSDENHAEQFNLILADPPYNHFVITDFVNFAQVLRQGGVLALSYPATKFAAAPSISGLKLLKSRQYAAAGIAIYQKDPRIQVLLHTESEENY